MMIDPMGPSDLGLGHNHIVYGKFMNRKRDTEDLNPIRLGLSDMDVLINSLTCTYIFNHIYTSHIYVIYISYIYIYIL